MVKNLFAAIMHPDCYVLIKADMAIDEIVRKDVAACKKQLKRLSLSSTFKGTMSRSRTLVPADDGI